MKICSNCGSQMPDEANACTNCGTMFKTEIEHDQPGQQPNQQTYQQTYQQSYQQPYGNPVNNPYSASNSRNTKAIVALILGVGGLLITLGAPFLAGVPAVVGLGMCIAGIVVGMKARNELPVGHPDRSMATGGFVCSIIGTVIGGIATCITCVCTCALCFTANMGLEEYLNNMDNIGDWSEYIDSLTVLFFR